MNNFVLDRWRSRVNIPTKRVRGTMARLVLSLVIAGLPRISHDKAVSTHYDRVSKTSFYAAHPFSCSPINSSLSCGFVVLSLFTGSEGCAEDFAHVMMTANICQTRHKSVSPEKTARAHVLSMFETVWTQLPRAPVECLGPSAALHPQ